MTPEAEAFFLKARGLLVDGATMMSVHLHDAAGRTAYLAAFHAAQALISEKTGRTVKTHRGVQTEFLRLIKADSVFPGELRSFLSHAYNLKFIADYEIGLGAHVPRDEAEAAIALSRRFVDYLEQFQP